ncbi:MAG: tripartite tricarboxylate transporter TctB family protein [Thermodesulfobacteriota bacterium]
MKKDLLLGIGMMLLALLFALDLRTVKNPEIIQNQVGVTLFPWLMLGALALLGLLLVVFSLVKMKGPRGQAGKTTTDWGRFRSTYAVPSLMFAILTAYIFLTPVIGFYVMSLLFFVGLGLLLGGFNRRNVITTCIGSVTTVLSVYLIFQVMLQVWMPQGLLF